MSLKPQSIDAVQDGLREQCYVADRQLATSIFLSLRLEKPLFLEGEAGVGKTEVAKVLSTMLNRKMIRLQCYEGLDISSAVYEWNYTRQMLHIRMVEASGEFDQKSTVQDIFGPDFLMKRPLLQAIDGNSEKAPVLLIDELDRADEEFEAFLLEVLSDFQITIPEIGTVKAQEIPIVLVTSNRTREIHDALKRRCLYHWIDYPSFEKEQQIILTKIPEAPQHLAAEVVSFVQGLRREDLYKRPGITETLDWVSALAALDEQTLSQEVIEQTLGTLLKYQDDIELVRGSVTQRILSGTVQA